MCLLFDMQQSHMKIFAHWHEAGQYGRVCCLTGCKAVAGEVLPKLYKWGKTMWTSQLGSFSVYSFGRAATTEYRRLSGLNNRNVLSQFWKLESQDQNGSRADSYWEQWRTFWPPLGSLSCKHHSNLCLCLHIVVSLVELHPSCPLL